MESQKRCFLAGVMVGTVVTIFAVIITYNVVMADAVIIPKVMLNFLEGK